MQFYVGRNINTNCSFFGGEQRAQQTWFCARTQEYEKKERWRVYFPLHYNEKNVLIPTGKHRLILNLVYTQQWMIKPTLLSRVSKDKTHKTVWNYNFCSFRFLMFFIVFSICFICKNSSHEQWTSRGVILSRACHKTVANISVSAPCIWKHRQTTLHVFIISI